MLRIAPFILALLCALSTAHASSLATTKHATPTGAHHQQVPWSQSYSDPSSPDNWLGGNRQLEQRI